jgi:methyl-accepting chemotaxis protein
MISKISNNLSVRWKLAAIVLLAAMGLLALSFANYYTARSMAQQGAKMQAVAIRDISVLSALKLEIQQIQSAVHRSLAEHDLEKLAKYEAAVQQHLSVAMARIGHLKTSNPVVYSERCERLINHLGQLGIETAEILKFAKNFATEQANAVLNGTYTDAVNLVEADLSVLSYQVDKRAQAAAVELDDAGKWATQSAIIIALAAFFLTLAPGFFLGHRISRRLTVLARATTSFAANDFSGTGVEQIVGRDEISRMARSLGVFKDNALRMRAMEAEQKEMEKLTAARQRSQMMELAAAFEGDVGSIVESLSQAAQSLMTNATEMVSATGHTSKQIADTSGLATGASHDMQEVASASVELSTTIKEVTRKIEAASSHAYSADKEASQTIALVDQLSQKIANVVSVTGLIRQITSQTNLLALNATIEAARAGEAGKGFAVVASEVKMLAGQTAKATDDIDHQIAEMQHAMNSSQLAVSQIGDRIRQISAGASDIATVAEQQRHATSEIANIVQRVALSTGGVLDEITQVAAAAAQTGRMSQQVKVSSDQLSAQSEALSERVSLFLQKIRAA